MNTRIAIIIAFALLSGCTKKLDEDAHAYLQSARQHYHNNDFTIAENILDSLPSKFRTAHVAKNMAKLLVDSIKRTKSGAEIDSLTHQINEYKIALLKEPKQMDILPIEQKIDSLEKLKYPYQKVISFVNNKETLRAQRSQCITCMQNIR